MDYTHYSMNDNNRKCMLLLSGSLLFLSNQSRKAANEKRKHTEKIHGKFDIYLQQMTLVNRSQTPLLEP